MKKFLFAIVFFCYSFSFLQAREVSMLTVDWEPYYASTLKNDGVYTEIVTTAFKRSGHKATVTFLPWTRALKYVADGKNDIVMGAYYNDERNKIYKYSDSCMTIHIGFVAHKKLGITSYKTLKDLKQYRIGVNRDWVYTPEFDSANYLKKDVATNQIINIRKFFRKRVEIIAISIEVFQYELSNMMNRDMNDVVVLSPLLDEKGLHLMMGRKIPDHEKIIADFNSGLKQIREDGTYGRILSDHGF